MTDLSDYSCIVLGKTATDELQTLPQDAAERAVIGREGAPGFTSPPFSGLVCDPLPSCSLQLEKSFKFMREAEDQLKAIPQFCFPDAKDWAPVQEFTR